MDNILPITNFLDWLYGFINYISKTIIYLVILFVWIMVLEKYIVNGIKNFKKYYFNDALSIIIVIVLV